MFFRKTINTCMYLFFFEITSVYSGPFSVTIEMNSKCDHICFILLSPLTVKGKKKLDRHRKCTLRWIRLQYKRFITYLKAFNSLASAYLSKTNLEIFMYVQINIIVSFYSWRQLWSSSVRFFGTEMKTPMKYTWKLCVFLSGDLFSSSEYLDGTSLSTNII